jgi:hypothetical protein
MARARKASVLLMALAVALAACGLLPSPPPVALTEAEAVTRAREAAPDLFRDEGLLGVVRGTYRDLALGNLIVLSGMPPTPDQCVFHVKVGHESAQQMGQGASVVLDCFTGEVIHVYTWST